MEINLEILKIQNPWWITKTLKFDPVLEKYKAQELQWKPEILKKIKFNKELIYSIQGPRGVGKTTILKLIIRKLLKKANHRNILYYSCYNLNSYEQLNSLIKEFIYWRRPDKDSRKKLYIIIDEISLLNGWQKGIEYLAQAGLLKNIVMVVSGSVVDGEEKNKHWKHLRVTSLDFKDFVHLLSPKIALSGPKDPAWQKNWSKQLGYFLDIYLLTGGYVSAINSFKKIGAVKQNIYTNFFTWLTTDIAKMGRDVFLFKQLMEEIITNVGRPVGYNTLTKHTKARTHLTIFEYINILESMFALKVVYQGDKNMEPSRSKAKKIYFRDPLIFWLFYSYIYGSLNYWEFSRDRLHNPQVINSLIDNVILSQLIKGDHNGLKVIFWRQAAGGKEINFIVKNRKGKKIPIINFYNQQINGSCKLLLKRAGFNSGIIVSNNILELKERIKIMPLEYFIYNYQNILSL